MATDLRRWLVAEAPTDLGCPAFCTNTVELFELPEFLGLGEVEFTQIGRGALDHPVSALHCGRIVIHQVVLRAPCVGCCAPALDSYLVLLAPALVQPGCLIDGMTPVPQAIFCYGPGEVHHCSSPESGEWMAVTIPETIVKQSLERTGAVIGGDRHLSFWKDEHSGAAIHLTSLVRRVICQSRCSPGVLKDSNVAKNLESSIASAFTNGLDGSGSRTVGSSRGPKHIVAAARAFIQPRVSKEIYVEDVCKALSVPERTLQRAFYDFWRISPIHYIRLRRLQAARQLLLEARNQRPSVKRAALESGFRDMGRFAMDYKELYGEHPSVTLMTGLRDGSRSRQTISELPSTRLGL